MTYTKAVVFDLYKTLIHIARETTPYRRLFNDIGLNDPKELKAAQKIYMTENFENFSALVERIKPGLDIDPSGYERELEMEIASALIYPETVNVLANLKGNGFQLGLISNSSTAYKKPFFRLGLKRHFDEVIFSCDVGLTKPDKRIYEIMIQNLGIDPERILMTGDTIHSDVDGPRSAGMRSVHLNREGDSPESINTLEGIFEYL